MTTLETSNPFPADVVSAVRQAAGGAPPRPRPAGFSLLTASPAERLLAPLIGLYLAYAVVRLPEVFEQVAVPHLPMVLMLVFIGILLFAIPESGWRQFWQRSKPLKLVAALLVVSLVTIPIGIWPSESLDFVQQRYLVAVLIFVVCLVFLRDRRVFRIAAIIYVLCTAVVCVDVLHTYDPNAILYNDDGDPIDPEVIAERPELRRLAMVGVSLDPNDFGAVLATTFPLALWLSVGSFRRRVFWTGIAGLMVAAVVPTQSRGSELGFAAVAVVIISVGARGWRRWLSGALILGCVAMFIMMATGIGAAGRFMNIGADDYNMTDSEGRIFFWKQGLVWMLKRPWGYGISNYSTYFGMLNGAERAAHSTWIQYGMELGVAGLVLFVTLCVLLVRGLRRVRKRAVALGNSHAAAKSEDILAGHMLAVLAGVLVTGTFLSNAYYPLMYMALGMAAAVMIGSPFIDTPDVTASTVETPAKRLPRRRVRTFPNRMSAG